MGRDRLIVLAAEAALAAWATAFLAAGPAAAALLLALGLLALVLRRRAAAVWEAVPGAFARQGPWALALMVAILAVIPVFLRADPYLIHILLLAALNAILALGLDLQVGGANMVNLGFAAFFGLGAYTSALMAVHWGTSFWVGLPAGGLVAAAFGLLLGLPALRTRDYYLSLVTIAFGLVVYLLLHNLEFTGGPNGILNIPPVSVAGRSLLTPLTLPGLALPYQTKYYYLVLAFLILFAAASWRLHHSRFGLTLNAVREDEIAARCTGIDVVRAKLLAFVIGAVYGGVAGVLYAHYVGFISAENFTFSFSIVLVCMILLGGMDHVAGVIAGAAILTVLPEKFRAFADYRLLLYGIVIVLMLFFRPRGIFPSRIRRYRFAGREWR